MDTFYDTPQPYLESLYKGLIGTAYYGLLRIGEVTQGPHVITAPNVQIGTNKKKLLFILESSKTHGRDEPPQIVKISAENKHGSNGDTDFEDSEFCPFSILRDYINRRKPYKSKNEQFFVFADRTPVKPVHFRMLLKELMKKCKLNPANYSCCHGMRAG